VPIKAARVSLSILKALVSGFFRIGSIAIFCVNIIPACGPPNNLSPLNVTTSAPASAIVIEPSQTKDVEITYAPTALGYNFAVLKITSDDPDEPTILVDLLGEGVYPPDISVMPDSISASVSVVSSRIPNSLAACKPLTSAA